MTALLGAAELRQLRQMEKVVSFDWSGKLLAGCRTPGSQRRLELLEIQADPVRGELHVYARQGITPDDYSAGLVLLDLSGRATTLMRLNGPHPNPHVNRYPVRVRLPVTPHVHHLTERYQQEHRGRPKVKPDGYALCTTPYGDLAGALAALARRANIVPATPTLPLPARSLP